MHTPPLWLLWATILPIWWGGLAVTGFMPLADLWALGVVVYTLLLFDARFNEKERARMTS